MITIGKREIDSIRIGNRVVASVYNGAKLVWQAVKSCFGSGFWTNLAPWSNDEGWKN